MVLVFGLLPGPMACKIPIAFMLVKCFTFRVVDSGEAGMVVLRAVMAVITLDLNNLFIVRPLHRITKQKDLFWPETQGQSKSLTEQWWGFLF